MNKKAAIEAFKSYADLYDTEDIKIKLKIDHTYRVADIASRIAVSVGENPDFSWFLGLLHDIGRFEQLTQYGTFKDAESVDHAELGADILFKDGKIQLFSDAGLLQDDFLLIDPASPVVSQCGMRLPHPGHNHLLRLLQPAGVRRGKSPNRRAFPALPDFMGPKHSFHLDPSSFPGPPTVTPRLILHRSRQKEKPKQHTSVPGVRSPSELSTVNSSLCLHGVPGVPRG